MTDPITSRNKRWYQTFPHPVVLLIMILFLTVILSYILPAGSYEREVVDGRERVMPGTYREIEQTPLGIMDMFVAIPLGYKTAAEIIFIVLSSGIMFGILEKAKVIENTVGVFVRTLGTHRRYYIVIILTYVYGLLGIMIGYENLIALVPIAAITVLAVGGDLILAAGIAVGGVTVGFGLSPINPYTVGTGHKIAELPLFSGAELRTLICFLGLTLLAFVNVRYFRRIMKDPTRSLGKGLDTSGLTLSSPLEDYRMTRTTKLLLAVFLLGLVVMLYGIFQHGWYINEISGIFIMISILCGLLAGMSGREISETAFRSISIVGPGAFMVGLATSIKVAMEMGNISDTIAFRLSEALSGLPLYSSAIAMSASQCVINLFIPSGSGQALATLPVMIPVGDLLGLTRQTTILAFQIGDGVTNLFNPTLGGLIAMLSMCKVPFDRWLRFIFPVVFAIIGIAWIGLLFAVFINYGPA